MILRNRIIHCIGDSHASFFSGYDRIQPIYPEKSEDKYLNLLSYRLGPVLAYNLVNLGSTSKGREKLLELLGTVVKPNHFVLLCFGEIDCRYHIIKNSIKNKIPIEEVIEDCVNRYVHVIKEVKSYCSDVIVYGPIASAADGGVINKNYPRLGTCAERNEVTRIFNQLLQVKSRCFNFSFLTLFYDLIDESLQTKTTYYMDEAHLSQLMFPQFLAEIRRLIPNFTLVRSSRINKFFYG